MDISLATPEKPITATTTSTYSKKDSIPQRLYSLDALRGFDMFWIIGAEEIFHGLADATGSPFWSAVSIQFTHPSWNGFHIYDLIFPLFLFLAGVSTPYSVGRELEKGRSRRQLMLRVIRRGLILVLLGIIYNNGLQLRPISDIRFSSVLGRIGIAYMLANIIYLYAKEKTQIIWFAGLLIGYWLILKFTSAPGFITGDLTMEGNFASYVDRTILPGKLSLGIHDTVGFFNNIPAISTALAGIIVGSFLKNSSTKPERKSGVLAISGIIFLLLAQLWNLDFPINKNMWSSSFVMHTTGLSLLLLSLFYYIIDVRGHKSWAFFFKVIGMNSILIYMSGRFINWGYTTRGFFQWLDQLIGAPFNLIIMAACMVLIKWLFLYLLYKKKMFFRV
jgi:predicted acyltransferase